MNHNLEARRADLFGDTRRDGPWGQCGGDAPLLTQLLYSLVDEKAIGGGLIVGPSGTVAATIGGAHE